MALWTSSYPVDAGDRDPSFCWSDADGGAALGDSNDMFAQFLDFEAEGVGSSALPGEQPGASFIMEPHHADGSASSEPSTADDFDFLSNSSNAAGPAMSATSYDIDPSSLTLFGGEPHHSEIPDFGEYPPQQTSVSDTELERLEGISLHSPKKTTANSDPSSPTPPSTVVTKANNTNTRKSKKFVDALSSTIRKATTMRKTRKPPSQVQRPASPTLDNAPQAVKQRAGRRVHTQHAPASRIPVSPPLQCDTNVTSFIHGACDDPFSGDVSPTHPQPPMRYYSQGGLGTPMDSPSRRSEHDGGVNVKQWQQQQQQTQWAEGEFVFHSQAGWWAPVDHKNIDANMAMHAQHGELPYDYSQIQDASSAGLMIHMPQPRPSQPGVVNDLTMNAQTYLPPPPPIPSDDNRSTRPPRAPSSGARHRNVSTSPMRKQRGPSASPTGAQSQRQSRHSSGGSISSVRSASGRLPGSMPGTPCSVRKRRSRDTGGNLAAGSVDDATGGSLGGGGIGFVNFTPSDGTVLMTGVAPSGSSKTKARREKEAMERRRRLSEAAMKAVAAAGGDIEKLKQQGFEF